MRASIVRIFFLISCVSFRGSNATEPNDLESLAAKINPNAPRPISNFNPQPVDPSHEVITCTTADGEDGECVNYYLCNDENVINTDGSGIIDIRVMGECASYLDTCCRPDKKAEKPITQRPIYPPVQPNPNPNPIHPTDPKYPPVKPTDPKYPPGQPTDPKYPPGQPINPNYPPGQPINPNYPPGPNQQIGRMGACGIRNENGVGFRIKGDTDNEAQFGEFPWMVAILKEEPIANNKDQTLNIYQCGGSLIHPKVVLTAAHCVNNKAPIKLKARAGEWDTQTKKEVLPYQDREVVKVVRHEHFYGGGLFNDIALLFLNKEFEEAENVGLVCLPPKGLEPPLKRCFASGWGKDVFGKTGKYQVILKKVELPIVERSLCQKSLRKTRLGSHFELNKSFICAGGEIGKDTCKGDGGSPLVCPMPNHPGHYMQSGIVAWGIGCGENGTPGVYAHVGHLREWIDEQMILQNLDLAPYQLIL